MILRKCRIFNSMGAPINILKIHSRLMQKKKIIQNISTLLFKFVSIFFSLFSSAHWKCVTSFSAIWKHFIEIPKHLKLIRNIITKWNWIVKCVQSEFANTYIIIGHIDWWNRRWRWSWWRWQYWHWCYLDAQFTIIVGII